MLQNRIYQESHLKPAAGQSEHPAPPSSDKRGDQSDRPTDRPPSYETFPESASLFPLRRHLHTQMYPGNLLYAEQRIPSADECLPYLRCYRFPHLMAGDICREQNASAVHLSLPSKVLQRHLIRQSLSEEGVWGHNGANVLFL